MAIKIKKDALALIVAGMSLFGTISAPVVAALMADDSPKLTQSCVEIYHEYQQEIAAGPAAREALLPGEDGNSIIESDPQAKYCGLGPEDFPEGP